MAKITFIKDGVETILEDVDGNLMEAAVENNIEGIEADCRGVCSCATCHVRVKKEWLPKLPPTSQEEKDLLELEDLTDECSRLSCQIEIDDHLDGLVVEIVEL
jgi:2Fe-2S ferredoxin